MDVLDIMQKAINDHYEADVLIALDKGMEEIERLREALKKAQCNCEEPCLHAEWCSSWIALSALKEKE